MFILNSSNDLFTLDNEDKTNITLKLSLTHLNIDTNTDVTCNLYIKETNFPSHYL